MLRWQRIGAIGQMACATGPHLHCEVVFLGQQFAPSPIFLLIDSGRSNLLRAIAPPAVP